MCYVLWCMNISNGSLRIHDLSGSWILNVLWTKMALIEQAVSILNFTFSGYNGSQLKIHHLQISFLHYTNIQLSTYYLINTFSSAKSYFISSYKNPNCRILFACKKNCHKMFFSLNKQQTSYQYY
jgi:hypothetical protein